MKIFSFAAMMVTLFVSGLGMGFFISVGSVLFALFSVPMVLMASIVAIIRRVFQGTRADAEPGDRLRNKVLNGDRFIELFPRREMDNTAATNDIIIEVIGQSDVGFFRGNCR